MAKKIHILPEDVSKSIAAGEVIERPASVVKELMENSIDAKSSEIIVELKSAGLQLIRVIDNGEGIEPEDVPIALQRYATSKIHKLEDLYSIKTLGFRGEALPSIASVSQMTIVTRVTDSISGVKVVCEGGNIISISEVGCPIGTEVEVKNLFYNLPVKRKFLKSLHSEYRNIFAQFLRLSLSHPNISFKMIQDDRMVYEHLKTDSLLVRIEAVMGKETYKHLKKIEYKNEDVELSGFISLPIISKSTPESIYLYVNKRFIKDRMIYKAINEAYRHHIESGKYPIAILFIDVPPSTIDVNVHPTKTEVKFKDSEKIFSSIFSAIRLALEEDLKRPKLYDLNSSNVGIDIREESERFYSIKEPNQKYFLEKNNLFPSKKEEEGFPRLHLLGQIKGTYLICEGEKDLIFIDQHAAHERVLFETLKKNYENHAMIQEKLLIPIQLELSNEESLIIDSLKEIFLEMGFEIEQIGERLYSIHSIPSFIKLNEVKEIIREIINELSHGNLKKKGHELFNDILTTISCHSAIKGNSVLRWEEMEELLKMISTFGPGATCPHGRPIFFFYPLEEVRKKFYR